MTLRLTFTFIIGTIASFYQLQCLFLQYVSCCLLLIYICKCTKLELLFNENVVHSLQSCSSSILPHMCLHFVSTQSGETDLWNISELNEIWKEICFCQTMYRRLLVIAYWCQVNIQAILFSDYSSTTGVDSFQAYKKAVSVPMKIWTFEGKRVLKGLERCLYMLFPCLCSDCGCSSIYSTPLTADLWGQLSHVCPKITLDRDLIWFIHLLFYLNQNHLTAGKTI